MPDGKPAGVPCVQLTVDKRCSVYDKPERPAVCASYQARQEFCGANASDALRILEELELMTGAGRGNGEGNSNCDG